MQYDPQFGFSEKLRYKCFVDEGIIYQDFENMIFQKSFWCEGADFESSEPHEINRVSEYLNLIFAGIPTGWMIHVNNILVNDNNYLDTSKNHFDKPLLKLIDREREYFFTRQAKLFKAINVITFTYDAKPKFLKKLSKYFVSTNKQQSTVKTFDMALDEFKLQLEQYTKLISRALKLTPMSDNETVTYLNYIITGKWINIKLPKRTYIDLKYLLGEDFISGVEGQIGNKHVRVIAIDNYFPDESQPLMLEKLRTLGFEMRWCTRFKFLTKLEAQKNISYLSDLHEQNISGIKGVTSGKVGMESRKYNRGAEYLYEEAEDALASSMISNVNFGKYSCNIVLYHEDESTVIDRAKIIVTTLQEMGFKARNEHMNFEEAFFSTFDGDVEHNERQSLISTENLADLLPLSGFWHGLNSHPSQLYPENSSPMFMVDCNNYHSFKGNLFVNDMGHSLVIGSNGTGKSTLINFIIASHMRYPNAQFFGLDYKNSMMPLTYGVNGEHYDLGTDDTAFQPLADIDTVTGYDFAIDWLETLCEINNVNITTDISNAIRTSLSSLSIMEPQHRTMKNLLIHASGMNQILADVIKLYVGDNTLQARIVGANEDRIKWSNFNVFELSAFIAKGEKALIPALKYIFYKIMGRLDGRPTLIVIEEAWMAFNSPVFAKQLDEWLKTLRKLNVYIVMVTLQVEEITRSSIKHTLLGQCASIIFTPNKDLEKTDINQAYKDFGLKDAQIQILKNAKGKKEYYISNGDGDRLFNLDMNYFEIGKAFMSRTSKDDMIRAKELKAQFKDDFANAWLKDSKIDVTI